MKNYSPYAPQGADAAAVSELFLIAANETGRICRGVELDPLYVEVIIRRYELATRAGASLVETGETFELWRLGGSTRENEETVLSFPAIPNLMWLMRWCSPRSSGRDEVNRRGNGFFFYTRNDALD